MAGTSSELIDGLFHQGSQPLHRRRLCGRHPVLRRAHQGRLLSAPTPAGSAGRIPQTSASVNRNKSIPAALATTDSIRSGSNQTAPPSPGRMDDRLRGFVPEISNSHTHHSRIFPLFQNTDTFCSACLFQFLPVFPSVSTFSLVFSFVRVPSLSYSSPISLLLSLFTSLRFSGLSIQL